MTIQKAFENFVSSKDFFKAADSSTKASWGGGSYSVELFPDESYRVLWSNQIGNLYDSPGIILSIPPLSDEEWDEDPDIRYYDDCLELLTSSFNEALLVK